MEKIPTINLEEVVKNYINDEVITDQFLNDNIVQTKVNEILKVLNTWGFFYLSGHQIPQPMIDNVFNKSCEFYEMPLEDKKAVAPTKSEGGYLCYGFERFHPGVPKDMKECFDYAPRLKNQFVGKVPNGFTESQDKLYNECSKITLLLLRLITLGLQMDDYGFFERNHTNLREGHTTSMRSLYYGAMKKEEMLPGQGRCGQHTDNGTITLLFQDVTGGLEVQSPTTGKYIPATPAYGTIMVNSADLLERWSSGRIKSTSHRVVMSNPTKTRKSIAFFVRPDKDVIVRCLDGSDKYEEVNAMDHFLKKANALYVDHKFSVDKWAGAEIEN